MTTTIRGTDNSAAAPALTGNDSDTGIYFPADNTVGLVTGGTERMRITSAGEVLVGGTTSVATYPSSALSIQGATTSYAELALFRNDTDINVTNTLGRINFLGNDTTSNTPTNLAYIAAVASGTHSAGANPTDLVFGRTPSASETVTEIMRLTNGGYLQMASGTNGILFNGDSAAANALDDYEEGTYTVTFYDASSGGNASPTTTTGYYTKIGNQVTCWWNATGTIDITGMTSTLVLYISLPFACNSNAGASGSVRIDSVSTRQGTGVGYVVYSVTPSQSRGRFFGVAPDAASASMRPADVSGGSFAYAALTYFTA